MPAGRVRFERKASEDRGQIVVKETETGAVIRFSHPYQATVRALADDGVIEIAIDDKTGNGNNT